MPIDDRLLDATREAFQRWVEANGGGPFEAFGACIPLMKHEIEYKEEIRARATAALELDNWTQMEPGAGEMLVCVQAAFREDVNLLQYALDRWARTNNMAVRAFFHPGEHVATLEELLRDLMLEEDLGMVGERFDALCNYLRSVHGFGCQWPPLSYLLFLHRSRRYFPVRPTQFQELLRFYGLDKPLAGYVSWGRYRMLLDVAEELRDDLSFVRPRDPDGHRADAIELQSYMYVVSRPDVLDVARQVLADDPTPASPDEERKRRENNAAARVRTGIEGEDYVVELERRDLAAYPELAEGVKRVSRESDEYGYDVLSFEKDGTEIHIEVKTTTRSPDWDRRFYLTAHEARTAEDEGDTWRLYRVTGWPDGPECHKLGNVIANPRDDWDMSVGGWVFTRTEPPAA